MKLILKEYTIEGTHEDIEWFLQKYPPYPMLENISITK